MQHEVLHDPSFAMLRVGLEPGETIVAEAGSMVARDPWIEMGAELNGVAGAGFFAKLKAFFVAFLRKLIGGETLFVNRYRTQQAGDVYLAPLMNGDIRYTEITPGRELYLSSGAYVAHVGNIDVGFKFGGLRSMIAKEGLTFLKMTGHGGVWFNSYGGVEEIEVDGSYIVDNGHIVGFEDGLEFKITTPGGGLMGFLASGEGLVCEFSGKGRVYIQSRNVPSLVDWVSRLF